MSNMFCFQCEQTAGCAACTGNAGVCGKKADTAALQDELTGALIGLARATEGTTVPTESTYRTIIEGLFTTITNVSFDNDAILAMIQKVRDEKHKLVPDCSSCASPCGRNDEYLLRNNEDETVIDTIQISQNDEGIDTEDRIEKLKCYIATI